MSLNVNLKHERKLQRRVKSAKRTLIVHVLGAVGVLLLLTLCVMGAILSNDSEGGLMFASIMGIVMGVPAAVIALAYQWSENAPYERFERAKYELEDFVMDTYV